jgi:hypothetical protein
LQSCFGIVIAILEAHDRGTAIDIAEESIGAAHGQIGGNGGIIEEWSSMGDRIDSKSNN